MMSRYFCAYLSAKERRHFMNGEYEKQMDGRIRELREKTGMTQEQLSARLQVNGCDITRSALAKIEVGQRHIYPDEIKLIKEILEVSFEEIFG